MSWFIAGLLGFAFGGVCGLVCGLMMADNYWKTKLCPYCDHDYLKYKEKKALENVKNDDKQEDGIEHQ